MDGSEARSRGGGSNERRQDKRDWEKILHIVERYATSGSGAHSKPAVSTRASLANHSCMMRQSGQRVRLKNTAVERKAAGSTYLSVEIACPVFGQRIIIMPMRGTPPMTRVLCVPLACEEKIKAQ